MAKNKTTETTISVTGYVNAIDDQVKREDSFKIIELMKSVSGCEAKMWGPSIIGFGTHHYKYESGREGDMPIVAFSPRKPAIVFYLGADAEQKDALLQKLGKHKTDGGCVYVKKLADIDMGILKKMIQLTISHMKKKHVC